MSFKTDEEDVGKQTPICELPQISTEVLQYEVIPVLKELEEIDPSTGLFWIPFGSGAEAPLDGMLIACACEMFGLEDPTVAEFRSAAEDYVQRFAKVATAA